MIARPALALLAALMGGVTCAKPAPRLVAETALLPIVLEITNYNAYDFDVWVGPYGQRARKIGVARGHRTARFVLEAADLPPFVPTRVVLIGPGVLTHLPEILARPGAHLRYIIDAGGVHDRTSLKYATCCRRGGALWPDRPAARSLTLPLS